jgi:1-carboxybiuret hydrolase subunit AtzG-like
MTKRAKSLRNGSKRTTKTPRPRSVKKASAKPVRTKRRPPSPDPLDALVDASARALGLVLEPEWRPAVKANLEVTLRLAETVTDFPLTDDAEPAPVFVA